MNRNTMGHKTWRELWRKGGERLAASGGEGADSPWLDASLLLSEAGGIDRTALFSRFPEPVPEVVALQFEVYLQQRISGEPVAYIIGRKEFWGLTFLVGPQVLTPRPDTETLVEAALEKLGLGPAALSVTFPIATAPSGPLKLLDLCCGSGCIGIALAHELIDAHYTVELNLSDLSPEAISTAKENSNRLLSHKPNLLTSCFTGSLFGALSEESRFHIIASNPPYLCETEVDDMVSRGWQEPELALRGGDDGLDLIRKIIDQGFAFLLPGGYLFIESASSQTETISRMLSERGYEDVETRNDLAGRGRISFGRRPEGERGEDAQPYREV